MAKIQVVSGYVILFDNDNKVLKSEAFSASTAIATAKILTYAKRNGIEVN